MPINPDAITETVKRAGRANTRITKGPDGKSQIEINEAGNWRVIQDGISQHMAEDLVQRATKGVILG